MDPETERVLIAEYPFHIVVMVKAAEEAIEKGRASIVDGMLVFRFAPTSPVTSRATSEANTSLGESR